MTRSIDLTYFSKVRAQFDQQDMPFLSKLLKKMKQEQPYEGLRLYHNIPLTLSTLIKIETLLEGGAEVIVSNMERLTTEPELAQALLNTGITLDLQKQQTNAIDIYLDCLAEMRDAQPPKLGYVELTQSGTEIYKNYPLLSPVISVDDSVVKLLEGIGTGEGFIRSMQEYAAFPLNGKKVVLFGYGKVGCGIHSMLLKIHADVTIIEKKQSIIKALNTHGFSAYHIDDIDPIKSILKTTDCIVTATGRTHLISSIFDKKDFAPECRLVNMGATDEFGEKFSSQDVLFNKIPINFALKIPTLMKFLDPIFYAHNVAIDYFLDKTITSGYHPFPPKAAQIIIDEWQNYHNISINELIPVFPC